MPPYNRGALFAAQFDLAATSWTVEAMLVTTSYAFEPDQTLIDSGTTASPDDYELTVGGYARQTLAGRVTYQDDDGDFAGLDATDPVFSSLSAGETVGGMVLTRRSTSGTTSDTGIDLIAYYPVTATPTNGGDITINFANTSEGGALRLQSTS